VALRMRFSFIKNQKNIQNNPLSIANTKVLIFKKGQKRGIFAIVVQYYVYTITKLL
jgi:hypothetical protein